jgi:LPXTG-site transpeptidase (sortase) family protein
LWTKKFIVSTLEFVMQKFLFVSLAVLLVLGSFAHRTESAPSTTAFSDTATSPELPATGITEWPGESIIIAPDDSFFSIVLPRDTEVEYPFTAAAKKSEPVAAAVTAPAPKPSRPTTPVRLTIPEIGFDNRIIKVGTNSKGEMAVPDGSTTDVGWYSRGTIPGNVGSAVIAAHVFAAFSNLHQLRAGSDIYVTDANGKKQHFVVQETVMYKLADLSPAELFGRNDARRLTLITCAGQLTADHSTYTHRLVVYAVLAA